MVETSVVESESYETGGMGGGELLTRYQMIGDVYPRDN